MSTEDAIRASLQSPNVSDSNGETANVVDVIDRLGYQVGKMARAILADAAPGRDATDGHVECLTEAVMGITNGLCKIAYAIDNLADAVWENL